MALSWTQRMPLRAGEISSKSGSTAGDLPASRAPAAAPRKPRRDKPGPRRKCGRPMGRTPSEYSQNRAQQDVVPSDIVTGVETRRAIAFLLAVSLAGLLRAQAPDAEGLFRQAVGEHQAGSLEAAVRDYRACLELAPQNLQARSNLGAALAGLGRYAEAIEQYRLVLEAAPGQEAVRLNLALAYYKSAQIPQAAAEFEALREHHPEDLRLNLLLGDCYLRQGQFARVVTLLQPLEPAHADDRALAYLLGTALIRSGQVREGEVLVNRILRDGESAEARLLMATSAMMSHDYAAALANFQRAIELNPRLPTLYSLYGQALLDTGDPEGAAAAFTKALAEDPGDFDAHLHLGQILQHGRRCEEAPTPYREALQERPGDAEARQGLEELLREAPNFAQGHARLAEVYARLRMSAAAARERRLAGSSGPADDLPLRPGDPAPDFRLALRGSSGTAGPRDFRGKSPLLLVFGSYTCPYLRGQIGAINALYERYGKRIGFLLVYVREAHTAATWQSTRNQREGIALAPAANLVEKAAHADLCVRNLKIRFPAVVDGMDQKVENAYHGWPSAAFLLDASGRILWRSRLNEQLFDRAALESAVDRVLAQKTAP